jgi:hypothetical protein
LFGLRRFLIPNLRLEILPLPGSLPAKEKGLHVRPCSPGIIPANFQEQQPRAYFTTIDAEMVSFIMIPSQLSHGGGLSGHGIDGDRDVFVDYSPGALLALVADGNADPPGCASFVCVGVDQAGEAVRNGQIATGRDFEVALFDADARRAMRKHLFPCAAVGGHTSVLIGRYGVEVKHVRRIALG